MNNNHNNELQRLLEDAFERLLEFFKTHEDQGMIHLQPVINDEVEKNENQKTFNYMAKRAILTTNTPLTLDRLIKNFDGKFRSVMRAVHQSVILHQANKAYLTDDWENKLKHLFFEAMKNGYQ